jgi:hypothetical protein
MRDWQMKTIVNLALLVTFIILFKPLPVWCQGKQNGAEKVYRIQPLDPGHRIRFDGELNEPEWESAEIATDLIQTRPREGAPARAKTELLMLYDEKNLYIGLRCWQESKTIVISDLKRDYSLSAQDVVEIVFDTFSGHTRGFHFAVNAMGAVMDAQLGNDGDSRNANWNAVLDAKTHIGADYWSAELVIPFKSLRFPKKDEQSWGFNFLRRVRSFTEDSSWSFLPQRYRVTKVSYAGQLVGLKNIRPGRNFKLKPFVSGSALRAAARTDKPDTYLGKVGLDLKYGVTSGLTLDFSANTDFSQVEADVQQTNLTRFSLFFPEKREFFLENSDIFHLGEPQSQSSSGIASSDLMLFYSRRIGVDPAGNPIPLLGGVRLSGRSGQYDVGIMNMQSKEYGMTPADNYTVARIRRTILRRSDIGAMFVDRQAISTTGKYNRAFGIDTNLRLTTNSTLSLDYSRS